MDVEAAVWSVNAFTRRSQADRRKPPIYSAEVSSTHERDMLDPATGQTHPAKIIARSDMAEGMVAHGPCIIVEDETSVITPPSRKIIAHGDGTLDMITQSNTQEG